MRIFLICFLLALPAVCAAGHDYYLLETDERLTEYKFTDLGYIWTYWAPASHDWFLKNSPEWIKNIAISVLSIKAVFLGAGFALAGYAIMSLLWMSKYMPWQRGRSRSLMERPKLMAQSRFKYKRK